MIQLRGLKTGVNTGKEILTLVIGRDGNQIVIVL